MGERQLVFVAARPRPGGADPRPRRADRPPRHPPPGRGDGAPRRPQRARRHDRSSPSSTTWPWPRTSSRGSCAWTAVAIVADGPPSEVLDARPHPRGLRRGPGARPPAGRRGMSVGESRVASRPPRADRRRRRVLAAIGFLTRLPVGSRGRAAASSAGAAAFGLVGGRVGAVVGLPMLLAGWARSRPWPRSSSRSPRRASCPAALHLDGLADTADALLVAATAAARRARPQGPGDRTRRGGRRRAGPRRSTSRRCEPRSPTTVGPDRRGRRVRRGRRRRRGRRGRGLALARRPAPTGRPRVVVRRAPCGRRDAAVAVVTAAVVVILGASRPSAGPAWPSRRSGPGSARPSASPRSADPAPRPARRGRARRIGRARARGDRRRGRDRRGPPHRGGGLTWRAR